MRISDWSSDVCSSDLGGAFSPELTQEFVQWYRAQSAKAGSELPDLGKTDLTVDEARARQAAVDRFQRERSDRQNAMVAAIPREAARGCPVLDRSEEHTSELKSLMRSSYAVFCLTQ